MKHTPQRKRGMSEGASAALKYGVVSFHRLANFTGWWVRRLCAQSLSRVWLFVTPWTVARQAPLSMRFPRQEYWSGLPFPPPGGLPDPGIELKSLGRQILYYWHLVGGLVIFWGRGGDFQELGHLPLWGLWRSALEVSWHLWVGPLACWCVTVRIYWSLRSSGIPLVCHLGPIWLQSVYVEFLGYVILFNVLTCLPPSCFRTSGKPRERMVAGRSVGIMVGRDPASVCVYMTAPLWVWPSILSENSRVCSGPVSPLLRTLCGPHLTWAKIQSPRGLQDPEQLAPLPPTLLLTHFLQPHRPPSRSSNTPTQSNLGAFAQAVPSAFPKYFYFLLQVFFHIPPPV